MGTTLAFNGAYNLAGAITQHPNDLPAALATYETKMRPIVDLAQRLPLGGQAPYIINLETAWGIWIRNRILWLIALSGIVELASRFAGPPADKVKVEEFGLSQLEEWVEGDDEK